MSEWKKYKIGDFAEVQNGYAFKSDEFSETGIPIVKIKNIVSPQISFADVQYFAGEISEKLKQFLIKRNDILISMTGSHLNQIASAVGKVGKYQFDFPAMINQRVGKVYVKDKTIGSEEYLYYFLNRFETQLELVSSAGGSANQANISPSQIKNLEIYLPEINIQNRIASILSSLDDAIELNQQTNKTLEEIAQTLFAEMCLPKNSGLPKGWTVRKLGEICVVNKNTLNKKADLLEWIDYIEISEVSRGQVGSVTRYNLGEEPSRAKRKLKHGDTVLSTVRPDRGSYFLSINPLETDIASTGFAVFSPTKVPFSFLYLFLTNEVSLKYYGQVANGAAYPSINPNTIMEMNLTIPDEKTLKEFHKIVEPTFLQIELNLKENQTLSSLRDLLLPKLMKGEIEMKEHIPDIGKMVVNEKRTIKNSLQVGK